MKNLSPDVVYLDDASLERLGITVTQVVAAIEDGLRGMRSGAISAAPKASIIAPDGRYMMSTLSASDALGFIAIKSVMVNDRNKRNGLPGINGGIMLLDSETGALRAVLDANWITAARTAGLSAVAAKRLANPDSASIGLIGTGVQAESHLRALAKLFPLRRVSAFGRGAAGMANIAGVADELGLAFEATSPRKCLESSDIVVSSVILDYSIEAFLDAGWLRSGSFAAITDLGIPWQQSRQTAFKRIYVDDLAQEKAMAKPLVATDLIAGDLVDLVVDGAHFDPNQSAALIFRGIAVGDLTIAALAFQRAAAR